VFQRMEVILTAAHLTLAAVFILFFAIRLRSLIAGRTSRVPLWDRRVPADLRVAKGVLALALLLLAPGLIYALSTVLIFTAVVPEYASTSFQAAFAAWVLLELWLCLSVGERLCAGARLRRFFFLHTVVLVAAGATALFPLIPMTLPYPDRSDCMVLDLPLRGPWLAGHAGTSALTNAHSETKRYAVDLLGLGPDGRLVKPSERLLANWYGYGRPVYAPASGRVAAAVDTLPCHGVGQGDPVNLRGNHVLIAVDGGRQILLAHLQRGSVTVAPGDSVWAGSLVGRVGNSGNSEAPHLHLDVRDTTGTTHPFRFRFMHRKRVLAWRPVHDGYLLRNDRFHE